MCRSSVDYAELFGLRNALSDLKTKKSLTDEENVVLKWLEHRIVYLEQKQSLLTGIFIKQINKYITKEIELL